MIRKSIVAVVTAVAVLVAGAHAVAAAPKPAKSNDERLAECIERAESRGGQASAAACIALLSAGSGLSSETDAQRWSRLCGGSGIAGYATSDDELDVRVEPVGVASGIVTETRYTEYGRNEGALEVTELGDFTVPTSGTYNVNRVTCTAGEASVVIRRVFAQGTQASPIEIRDRVVASLRIPEPSLAGAPSLVESYSIVKIPTWFWIEDWEPTGLTDTETLDGLSVSVTATPVMSTWDPGDGSLPLNCPNGGTPWQPGMNENQTVCSHTYTKSTAGQPNDALNIDASITWDLTWSVNNTPQGTFDTYTNTTTLSHQVGEIQAILVKNDEPPTD